MPLGSGSPGVPERDFVEPALPAVDLVLSLRFIETSFNDLEPCFTKSGSMAGDVLPLSDSLPDSDSD